jgi:hypothetical protein
LCGEGLATKVVLQVKSNHAALNTKLKGKNSMVLLIEIELESGQNLPENQVEPKLNTIQEPRSLQNKKIVVDIEQQSHFPWS